MSFRMHATLATLGGLPASLSSLYFFFSFGSDLDHRWEMGLS